MSDVLEITTATESILNKSNEIKVTCQSQTERQTVDILEDIKNSVENNDSFVLKPPKSNSKLILQNMEEVLKSVKKKHKQKHKRKKEQRRLAELAEKNLKHMEYEDNVIRVEKVKEPLRDKSANENDLFTNTKIKINKSSKQSPLKCSTPVTISPSIMNHFYPSPKKEVRDAVHITSKTDKVNLKQRDHTECHKESTKEEYAKPANVFDMMMNARIRSIGTNDNGQEPTKALTVTAGPSEASVSRKFMLHDWAERKGGAKRRLLEEERALYVDHQMDQRAKRLKKLLTNPEESSPNKVKARERQKAERTESMVYVRTRRISSIKPLNAVNDLPKNTIIESEYGETSDLFSMHSPSIKSSEIYSTHSPKETLPKFGRRKLKAKEENEEIKLVGSGLNKSSGRVGSRRIGRIANESDCIVNSSSSRPRRSCTNKIRYNQDADERFTSTENQKKTVNDYLEIDLDSSSPKETSKNLAPLFVRQMPRPNIDPDTLRARAEFLRSGIPEKLKKCQEKQKQWEQQLENSHPHFPCISHVQQMSKEEITLLKMKPILSHIKLRNEFENGFDLSVKQNKKKEAIDEIPWTSVTNCMSVDFHQPWRPTCRLNSLSVIDNKRNIVKAWKKEYDRFPTYKCYNQMCEKYRYFRAINNMQDMQQVSESFVVTRQSRYSFEPANNAEIKLPETAPNGELLFTEKYKPLLFDQVLVNLTPVQMLRDFLANWTTTSGDNPCGIQRNYPYTDDSLDFANDSSSSAAGNTIVLLGPSSSGKTNAVYALANEMNFNVLEINAGMRRTGKRLLQELHEATQSHQIRKDSYSNNQVLKMSLNSLKSKQKKSSIHNTVNSLDSDPNKSDRKSLILIEDADVLFDQIDAGFIDAIYTLAGNSKRPVIVVATDPNCAHLQRLMQQNTLKFFKPNVLSICRFLSVLALIENCPILLDDLISLYSYNNKNLRKTLLELQFFVQSGGDLIKESELSLTPHKNCSNVNNQDTSNSNSSYFASPNKRNLLENLDTEEQQDEQLNRMTSHRISKGNWSLYLHNTLFEFFTCAQNEKSRIPFPVDFQLLRVNFNDILRVSDNLFPIRTSETSPQLVNKSTKHQSHSPKKTWLNSATACEKGNCASDNDSLKTLCSFYENISVANLLDSCETQICMDRLHSHLSEHIAHALVEGSLVVNLSARICPYNLFDTARERLPLCDQIMGNCQLRTRTSRALDYEPMLRSICRSEKQRALVERRSCRFYHYLRNFASSTTNFSMESVEEACYVFQEELSEET